MRLCQGRASTIPDEPRREDPEMFRARRPEPWSCRLPVGGSSFSDLDETAQDRDRGASRRNLCDDKSLADRGDGKLPKISASKSLDCASGVGPPAHRVRGEGPASYTQCLVGSSLSTSQMSKQSA